MDPSTQSLSDGTHRLKAAVETHPEASYFTETTLVGLGANVATRKSVEEGA